MNGFLHHVIAKAHYYQLLLLYIDNDTLTLAFPQAKADKDLRLYQRRAIHKAEIEEVGSVKVITNCFHAVLPYADGAILLVLC